MHLPSCYRGGAGCVPSVLPYGRPEATEQVLEGALAHAAGAGLLEGELADGRAFGQRGDDLLVLAAHGEGQVQAAIGDAACQCSAALPQRQTILQCAMKPTSPYGDPGRSIANSMHSAAP